MQTGPVGHADELDVYAYVANDPLDKANPSGTDDQLDFGFTAPSELSQTARRRLLHDAPEDQGGAATLAAIRAVRRHRERCRIGLSRPLWVSSSDLG